MPVKKYSESSKMRAKMPENVQKVHFFCVSSDRASVKIWLHF